MIEVHSVIVVLALEALVVLLLALLFAITRSWLKKRRERGQVDHFVDRINRQEDLAQQPADHPVNETNEELLPGEVLQETLETVNQREKALYRHVLQAFLQRDVGKLAELDQYVRALSEPYTRLIQDLLVRPPKQDDTHLVEQVRQARAEALKAREEAERMKQKLGNALNTLNNVSSEYAKMFHMPEVQDAVAEHQAAPSVNPGAPWLIPPADTPAEENP